MAARFRFTWRGLIDLLYDQAKKNGKTLNGKLDGKLIDNTRGNMEEGDSEAGGEEERLGN
jgi:hypothetical protein